MSSRISSRVVPSAATENACVWPRVKSAEPCVRGAIPTSIEIVADLVGLAAVGALLVDRDPRADRVLLELVEGELHRLAALDATRCRRPRSRRPRRPPPRPSWSRPGARACPRPGWPSFSASPNLSLISPSSFSSTCGTSTSAFSLPAFFCSSRCASHSFLISPWAMSSASRISASVTSLAPASTIRMASSVPATIRSSSPSSSDSSSGLTTNAPSSSLPMRTAPTGIGNGMSEIISAALAPFMARMSYGFTWSTDIGIATSCVSRRQPLGKSGRIGRSIMRAVSVPFSPARPSRLKKLPGILPAAYMRSSTSTVRGRKSTSLRFPAVAVERTIVSPALHDHGAAGLLGQLAGLERNLVPPDLDGDPAYIAIHYVPFGRLRLAATCFCPSERVPRRLAAAV